MIFNTKATQKNACQKLTDASLPKGKSNELWSELDETSEAAVSGGGTSSPGTESTTLRNTVLGPGRSSSYVNSFTFDVVNL